MCFSFASLEQALDATDDKLYKTLTLNVYPLQHKGTYVIIVKEGQR